MTTVEVEDDAVIERISRRNTCAGCGEGCYDTYKQLLKHDACENCRGSEFSCRADDNAETVAQIEA